MTARGSWDDARRTALGLAAITAVVSASTGLGAQLRVLDTSGVRWVHHLLYGVTVFTVAAAGAAQAVLADRRRAAMAPAAAALTVLARTSGGTARHAGVGAVAAMAAGLGAVRGR